MPADLGELGISDYNEDMIFFVYLLAISAIIQALQRSVCFFIQSCCFLFS